MADNDDRFRVLILGYGEMGHAMEHLLAARHQLDIWEKFPAPGFQSVILEESVPLADIVIFCLPVNPHREVITQIAPLLSNTSLCISIAKGLDEAGQTAAQIFQDVLAPPKKDGNSYGLLYGPMISEEIRSGRFAFAQFGCADRVNYRKVKACFKHSSLFIEHTPDISGISWSVILKNVYAMLFGMADELKLGDNMRGYLSVAALREISGIVDQKGGLKNSSYHLAGLGDLITTATSENSHHHTLGRMLAREETENIAGEGVHTLEMVNKFHLVDTRRYPLFELIQTIVNRPVNVRQQIAGYLQQIYGLQ
jgi:glycerol-3-phosphate dehydrogenase (NAD(P)+)